MITRNHGKLYIVSTSIGNLSDITYRAIETLKSVDLIAAEDTRHTRELLNHFDIKTKTTSLNEHTDEKKIDSLIKDLKEGKDIALVSDAGTPIISDPGAKLTRKVIANDIELTAVPGACAAINALVMSGIDAKAFTFIGFLPEDNKHRKELLSKYRNETNTMIFYISSHNLKKDLKSLIETFGEERLASLSREMTKIHEENVRDSLSYISKHFDNKDIKGEFVLVVEGLDKNILKESTIKDWLSISIDEHMKVYIDAGLDEKEAMKKVAKDRNIKKNDVYKLLKT